MFNATTKRSLVQQLYNDNFDGRITSSFGKNNPIASALLPHGIDPTRKWFYLLTQKGEQKLLIHRLDKNEFNNIEVDAIHEYTSWHTLQSTIREFVGGIKRVCTEYSYCCTVPQVSTIDAGTYELLTTLGLTLGSSANIIQLLLARRGGERGVLSHQRALSHLETIMGLVAQKIIADIATHGVSNEYEVQLFIKKYFDNNNLETCHAPIVAIQPNNADPHYMPSQDCHSLIKKGDLVMVDIRAKEKIPGSIYADITHMMYVGNHIPGEIESIWQIVRDARNQGLQYIVDSFAGGKKLEGWEVDDAVRTFITNKGYGDYFIHRTGHSIQEDVHGKGANIDNFELHDTRILIPDTGFSIEPGIYIPNKFGIRSEIDIYIDEQGAPHTFCTKQQEITLLLGF